MLVNCLRLAQRDNRALDNRASAEARPRAERRERVAMRFMRSWRAWLAQALKRSMGWIASQWQLRRDMQLLDALDDRQLADIGLHRESLGAAFDLRLGGGSPWDELR